VIGAALGPGRHDNDARRHRAQHHERRERQFISLKEVFNGLVFSADGKKFYVSGGDSGDIYVFRYTDGKAELEKTVHPGGKEAVFLAGLAVQTSTGKLYVCNEGKHEVWELAADSLKRERTIPVGQHPHSCILGADGKHLYVSNWGSRSVSVINLKTFNRVRDIEVGIRPNDMALAPDGRLFVACAGDNTVHVIVTARLEAASPDASPSRRLAEGAREILSTSLYPASPEGSTPCGVAISPDGKTLFVANADQNSVMLADILGSLMEDAAENDEKISLVNGFIPAGWYPTAVAVSPDNKLLLVGNGKGLSSNPSWPPKISGEKSGYRGIGYDNPAHLFQGSISFIERPDSGQMAKYTEQVRRNSSYRPENLVEWAQRKNADPAQLQTSVRANDPRVEVPD